MEESAASERAIGITKELWFLQGTPNGDCFVAYIESPDFGRALGMLAESQETFDVWFKKQLVDMTGVDLNEPPPGSLSELLSQYERRMVIMSDAGRAGGDEIYTLSGTEAQESYVGTRTAAVWVPFFLPHLRPGMSLLDCGYGVGSITLDLAERVAPGQVVGIDLDESQLATARAEAERRGLGNVRFEAASIYDIPFPAASFDAALAHTLLFHLNDPARAAGIASHAQAGRGGMRLRRRLEHGGLLARRSARRAAVGNRCPLDPAQWRQPLLCTPSARTDARGGVHAGRGARDCSGPLRGRSRRRARRRDSSNRSYPSLR